MKQSQYLESYLRYNELQGFGNGVTPQTYLFRVLSGKAAKYSLSYLRSLEKALVKSGAVTGRSAKGFVAWYPASLIPKGGIL